MPRKRATRAQTLRAKPTLSASDDDDIINGMTRADRAKKLNDILTDFKLNAEVLKKEMEEELDRIIKTIDKHFSQARLTMSPEELQMTVEDYVDFLDTNDNQENVPMDCVQQTAIQSAVLNKYKAKQTMVIETIPEDGAVAHTSTAQTTRTRRQTQKKKSKVEFSNQQQQNSFVTPAANAPRAISMLWGPTPMVTPKFDPRLPITPAIKRNPKAGEVLMSMEGSPINNRADPRKTTIVMDNGEELDIEIPEKSDINSMMKMFSNIIKKQQANR